MPPAQGRRGLASSSLVFGAHLYQTSSMYFPGFAGIVAFVPLKVRPDPGYLTLGTHAANMSPKGLPQPVPERAKPTLLLSERSFVWDLPPSEILKPPAQRLRPLVSMHEGTILLPRAPKQHAPHLL